MGLIQVIVGLGNPGSNYAHTRHNIGFDVIDRLVTTFEFVEAKVPYKATIYKGKIGDVPLYLIKPQNFMNLSGSVVQQCLRFYKVPLDQLLVIHDDIDLILGQVKIKIGGGAGGHNGLKSIDQQLGKDYTRLRIGVDHPGHRDAVSGYVLKRFKSDEQPVIDHIMDIVVMKMPILCVEGKEKFLTELAVALKNK